MSYSELRCLTSSSLSVAATVSEIISNATKLLLEVINSFSFGESGRLSFSVAVSIIVL